MNWSEPTLYECFAIVLGLLAFVFAIVAFIESGHNGGKY